MKKEKMKSVKGWVFYINGHPYISPINGLTYPIWPTKKSALQHYGKDSKDILKVIIKPI